MNTKMSKNNNLKKMVTSDISKKEKNRLFPQKLTGFPPTLLYVLKYSVLGRRHTILCFLPRRFYRYKRTAVIGSDRTIRPYVSTNA